MSDYTTALNRRIDAQTAQRWIARAGIVALVAGPLAGLALVAFWLDHRLDEYQQSPARGEPMAVIDKCGNSYEFTMTRSGEWQPDEALYFDKLEWMIDCTRGLRVPSGKSQSCWLKVWPMLAPPAHEKLMEFTGQYCKEQRTCPLELAKHQVEVEILKGSTKSEDGRYRLQWREREPANGRDEYWSGVFTLSRVAATKKSVAEGNAIGMQIDSFTWQRDQVVGKK